MNCHFVQLHVLLFALLLFVLLTETLQSNLFNDLSLSLYRLLVNIVSGY